MSCAIHWTNTAGNKGRGGWVLTRDKASEYCKSLNEDHDDITHWFVDREVSKAIAQLVVIKNLPAGQPCWMARVLASYIYPA
jgi:hypothetical protein